MSNATPSPSHYKEASPHSQHELRTARAQKRPQLGYVKTTKVLNKLDVLSTTAQAILTKIDGLTETVAEIDWIMETETPQLSSTVARLKETCHELIEGYQESLAILDQQQV
jgi:response regulator RpfG family c-di-GMP phosphodiesterase